MYVPHESMPLAERRAFTLHVAEDYSGLKRSTLYELLASGEIESIKVAGRRLFLRESLDRLLGGKSVTK